MNETPREIDVTVSEVGPRDGLADAEARDADRDQASLDRGTRRRRASGDRGRLLRVAETAAADGRRRRGRSRRGDDPRTDGLALAPNLKGAERAFDAGVHKLSMPVSASRLHSKANINMTPEEAVAQVARSARCATACRRTESRTSRSGFRPPSAARWKAPIDEDWVIRLAVMAAEAGADTVGLSDTVGAGNPAQVKRMFTALRRELGDKAGGGHFHNTRGQGLANVVAALEAGVTTFDASQGGMGGCPYAPGASGNIVTEDLVFLLEAMGLRTGIDLDRLIAARAVILEGLPGEPLHGHVPAAGVPLGFVPACRKREPARDPRQALPLAGIKVVEFSHMVMGPSCGLILADLGADVIKVEPVPDGDNTRRLPGSGAGFFATFNRNKRSLALDLKTPEGIEFAKKLIQDADVVTENFRPGGIDALGLGYDVLKADNPGLIYCSLKGFLSGPYEQRAALDEVVQMMGGLAYMTGPPGRPLRAGASVNDIMGGMFAAIGILAALNERTRTGQGQLVKSALFENNMFLVAQHMIQFAVTGQPAAPMPERISAWAVYDVFPTSDGQQVFVGVVSDTQWRAFCDAFGLQDLLADPALSSNPQRVDGAGAVHADAARPARDIHAGGDLGDLRTGAPALRSDHEAGGNVRRPAPQISGSDDRRHPAGWPDDAGPRPAAGDEGPPLRPPAGRAPRRRAQRLDRRRTRLRAGRHRTAGRGRHPRSRPGRRPSGATGGRAPPEDAATAFRRHTG